MPHLRGVDVSVVTYPGGKRLPEFPHPPAPSICIPPPTTCTSSTCESESNLGVDSPSIHQADSFVSVYIPSAPGSQFGVYYSVIQMVPKPPCYVYFKIFLNGRNITSWGVDPVVQASGSVTRALFEPDDRWHNEDDGVIHRRQGIEARCLYFLPASSSTSVSNDGGLIEVQVFRSKGRKRRAPLLAQHRGRESYGIVSPSEGLLESPEDAYYYSWLLTDPKECPFASFRFHYRSWSNLHQLSLVPAVAISEQPDADKILFKPRNGTSLSSRNIHIGCSVSALAVGSNAWQETPKEDLAEELSGSLRLPTPTGQPSWGTKTRLQPLPHPCAHPSLPRTHKLAPCPSESFESYTPSIAHSPLSCIVEASMEAEEAKFNTVAPISTLPKSRKGWVSSISKAQQQQPGPSDHSTSPSSSCSWPLGNGMSDREWAVDMPQSQESSLVTSTREGRECETREKPTLGEVPIVKETVLLTKTI
ncbi:hypothetical protein B0J13DRAFT_52257 [Dactylonectria estremocensis]|uniref:Uncharacterized protein n=1 Tax=Dactylonectria estremocensis TaxID=1079267 RepID=A0A9P9ENR1_9HYPO|nr:hypothetical protein B0J13DRAFT_52257 [Dactylonectria estremocensis]